MKDLILTRTQANAVYDAFCSLDAVGIVADSLELRNAGAFVDIHATHKGRVTVTDHSTCTDEHYACWSDFSLSYGLV